MKLCQHPLLQLKRPQIREIRTRRISKWHVTGMVGAIVLQQREKFPKDPSHVAESPSCGLSSPLCPFTGAAAAVLQSAREKAVLGLQIFCHAGKVGVTSTGVQSEREGLVPPCPVPQRNKAFPPIPLEKKIHSVVWQSTQQHF